MAIIGYSDEIGRLFRDKLAYRYDEYDHPGRSRQATLVVSYFTSFPPVVSTMFSSFSSIPP